MEEPASPLKEKAIFSLLYLLGISFVCLVILIALLPETPPSYYALWYGIIILGPLHPTIFSYDGPILLLGLLDLLYFFAFIILFRRGKARRLTLTIPITMWAITNSLFFFIMAAITV
ncbi:MAG: hypothetical protein KJ017_04630 [Alphaproteobacteria bacterium]|nr:hypothetical protein [Alphaproteobacteria bacterium]